MQVERYSDVPSFRARVDDFLVAREAEHNLLLGLCARLAHDPRTYGSDPYLATVVTDGAIVATALRTPPHNLVLSEIDDERALKPLAFDLRDAFGALPGVLGPTAPVERFARLWEKLTGARTQLAIAQRIYRADAVTAPTGVAGRMRPYTEGDRDVVLAWLEGFGADAHARSSPESASDMLERRLRDPDGGFVLWEPDGDPVSVAGYGGPTPSGIRIGPVYTPPQLRRRGYASAVTAELTRTLLEGGRQFCFLFTDLANPTSNSIYQRIGYRPVSDVNQWSFE